MAHKKHGKPHLRHGMEEEMDHLEIKLALARLEDTLSSIEQKLDYLLMEDDEDEGTIEFCLDCDDDDDDDYEE